MDDASGEGNEVNGHFVVLEGIDGCGSTTQARRLVQALVERGHDARLTCEPTSGPIGRLIRQALQRRLTGPDGQAPHTLGWATLGLLFAADRLDHVDTEILPALRQGALVVSDRYDLSSLAYQSATSETPDDAVAWLRQLNARAVRPHLTIVLDVPEHEAAARRASRDATPELFEVSALQQRLAEVYRRAERLVPADPVLHLSGVGDPDAIAQRVLEAVLSATGRGRAP